MALRGQAPAGGRPAHPGAGAAGPAASVAGGRIPGSARLAGNRALSDAAHRLRRQAICDAEVPHHARRRRRAVADGSRRQRITPVGRFLRKSRLDELPQLWNILGERCGWSAPGQSWRSSCDIRAEYEEILSVPPGIAGRTQLRFALVEADLLDGSQTTGRPVRASADAPEGGARPRVRARSYGARRSAYSLR